MKRTLYLGALLAAVAGFALWQRPELLPWSEPERGVPVAQQTAPAVPAASAPAEPEEPVEQVGEAADRATGLQEILPRQSAGRAQGLDKTPDPLRLHSSAAVVVDADTRNLEYAKNEDVMLPIASITKLMTAMVIVESKVPMEAPITITEDDMDRERHSRSRLRVGTVLTRSEALHLALMSSENRAAHALGRTWPEGLDKFVEAMNRKAKQLGMDHTNYADPTGLSSANQSTARDLATLVLAASRYPLLRQYSTDAAYLTRVSKRPLQYVNSNRLVRGSGWDVDLQKTGYIIEAGHCMVMQAKLAGRDKVLVLLDADSNGRRSADAERIRSWVYQQAGVQDERKLARAKPAARSARKAVASAKPARKANTKVAKGSKGSTEKKAVAKAGQRQRKTFSGPADHRLAQKKGDDDGS